jgi:calcineurin-like phosphoesterase
VKKQFGVDFAVVNGENANVVGVTPAQCEEIFAAGADVVTWATIPGPARRSSRTWRAPPLSASANYAPQCPGRGVGVYDAPFGGIAVINAIGRFTLDANTDNPSSWSTTSSPISRT